jgi:hypothetical protein
MLQNSPPAGRKSFGRRGAAMAPPPPAVPGIVAAPALSTSADIAAAPVDRELEEWKRARRQNFALPWRQLSFLGSLFFGVASLASPDTVNDTVQWLLYGLMAASLYAGFAARRKAKSG